MAPKRRARQSPKARSAEPAVEVSPPSKPDVVEMAPPTVEAPPIVEAPPAVEAVTSPTVEVPPTVDTIMIPPLMASSGQVLGLAKEEPVTNSPAPIVEPAHPPVAAVNSEPEYNKTLTRERIVWGVVVAVSWAVTFVALLRLGII